MPKTQTKEEIEAELQEQEDLKWAGVAGLHAVSMIEKYGATRGIQLVATALAQMIGNEVEPDKVDHAIAQTCNDIAMVARGVRQLRQEVLKGPSA